MHSLPVDAKSAKHFASNPLSDWAIGLVKADAVNNHLSFDANCILQLSTVFDFIAIADTEAEDFESLFLKEFGEDFTPLSHLEYESVNSLAEMITSQYDTAIETVRHIIIERELN